MVRSSTYFSGPDDDLRRAVEELQEAAATFPKADYDIEDIQVLLTEGEISVSFVLKAPTYAQAEQDAEHALDALLEHLNNGQRVRQRRTELLPA